MFHRNRKHEMPHWYDGPPPGAVEGVTYRGIVSWPAVYLVQGYDLDGPAPWSEDGRKSQRPKSNIQE